MAFAKTFPLYYFFYLEFRIFDRRPGEMRHASAYPIPKDMRSLSAGGVAGKTPPAWPDQGPHNPYEY
jgi:hypothetical protein